MKYTILIILVVILSVLSITQSHYTLVVLKQLNAVQTQYQTILDMMDDNKVYDFNQYYYEEENL